MEFCPVLFPIRSFCDHIGFLILLLLILPLIDYFRLQVAFFQIFDTLHLSTGLTRIAGTCIGRAERFLGLS